MDDVLKKLREIIIKADKAVDVKEVKGKIMGADGFVFNQEDVFKYALAKTKSGYTFHSMAMYSNPVLHSDFKSKMRRVKFQKGCVNFKSLEDFPLDIFEEHMKKSAKSDFSMVINHYKNKKK